MTRLIAVLAHLPAVRRAFLTVLFLAGLGDMVASIVLLAYQLTMTSGYQHVVPSIVITSFLCTAFPIWFLYSKPYSIRLPGSSGASEPHAGGVRDKVAKFSRSIAAELMALAGTGVWVLISVSNLHAETPGLINHCGGWPICRMLLAVLALTWICFLFLALPFALLLCSTLYFTIRRHSPLPIFVTSFLAVDWERYSGRPVNRAATVKRTKKGKPVCSPRILEGSDGSGRPRGTDSQGRPDSQAPVFAFHPGHGAGAGDSHLSYGGASSIVAGAGTGTGTDAHRSLDWDVRSSFERPGSSVFTASGGEVAPNDGAPAPKPEHSSVFVLMEEEEKAMEAEAEAEAEAAGAAKEADQGSASAKEVGAAL